MILIIAVFLLILGIAFFQSTQGFYSSLIMAVLTLCCALAAFNYYEPVADAVLLTRQPATAYAITLVALFFLPLLVLRLLFDRFVGNNVLVGVWADRIAGGAMGLFTGMICAGVLTIGMQMLPWGPTVMGYQPFDDSLKRNSALAPLYPDEFTLGLVNMLSGGAMSNPDDSGKPHTFSQNHPDLLLESFCFRNMGKGYVKDPDTNKDILVNLNGNLDIVPGTMTAEAYQPDICTDEKKWDELVAGRQMGLLTPSPDNMQPPMYPLMSDEANRNSKLLIIRCNLSNESGVTEEDGRVRLAATQFRLVTKSGQQYYPVGYLTHLRKTAAEYKQRNDPKEWMLFTPPFPTESRDKLPQIGRLAIVRENKGGIIVDWVYRIPADQKPDFVQFRWADVAKINVVHDKMPDGTKALNRK